MSLPGPTLCIDVGGNGIKSLLLDPRGAPAADSKKATLPRPSNPGAIVDAIEAAARRYKSFERLAVGIPGVVVEDVVRSSPRLGSKWKDVALGRQLRVRLERLVRVANSTDLRGLGIVEGSGVELVLMLGEGLGSALFVDGRLVPNFQLGLHPAFKGHSYDEYVSRAAFDAIGTKRWSKRVVRVIEQVRTVVNPTSIHLTGANLKRIKSQLPDDVRIAREPQALVGGYRLWD